MSRLVKHKGLELVEGVINELANENIQLVVLGTGDSKYEDMFKFMDYTHSDKVSANITFSSSLASEIYAGADFLLMPSKSEPCGLSQMIALRYGSIPVVRKTGGLADSIQDSGLYEGNGFVFENYNADEMAHAVYRAVEGYKNKEGWAQLRKRAMQCDNSWNVSANAYIRLYKEIINK